MNLRLHRPLTTYVYLPLDPLTSTRLNVSSIHTYLEKHRIKRSQVNLQFIFTHFYTKVILWIRRRRGVILNESINHYTLHGFLMFLKQKGQRECKISSSRTVLVFFFFYFLFFGRILTLSIGFTILGYLPLFLSWCHIYIDCSFILSVVCIIERNNFKKSY